MSSETILLTEIRPPDAEVFPDAMSSSNQLRASMMNNASCSVGDMDQQLVALFRLVTGDPQSDLCCFLSTRLTALQFSMIDITGQWEIFISPDSPLQTIDVMIRQGDVRYECKRHLGHAGPYGGNYEGFKLYAEVGAIPICDTQVLQLLRTAIQQINQRPDAAWHRRISLRTRLE